MDNTNALINKYLNIINAANDDDSDVASDDESDVDLTTTSSTSDSQQSIYNKDDLIDKYIEIIKDSGDSSNGEANPTAPNSPYSSPTNDLIDKYIHIIKDSGDSNSEDL